MLVFHISKPITATYASLTYQGLQGILISAYIPFLNSRFFTRDCAPAVLSISGRDLTTPTPQACCSQCFHTIRRLSFYKMYLLYLFSGSYI